MSFIGKGRQALDLIIDKGSLVEDEMAIGPGAITGIATIKGCTVTIIANDAKARNPRFPTVAAGVIGLEEAYKMAIAVYKAIKDGGADKEKRPIILIVDTPGNAPGKIDEIFGMNKATGAYQLALAEARQKGHPIVAMIVGRAISGAFLCHGLQADRIIALSEKYNTMIHVMPLSSIARITRMDIERLKELSASNPVFASGASYFHKLGGVEEIVEDAENMSEIIHRNITEIYQLNSDKHSDKLGPSGRGKLGAERGGRTVRPDIIDLMRRQFAELV